MQHAIESLVAAIGRVSIDDSVDRNNDVLLVFDPRMLLHVSPRQHPEQASRIISIFARLQAQGLTGSHHGVRVEPADFCSIEDVLAVHPKVHVDAVLAQDRRSEAEADAAGGRMFLDPALAQDLFAGGLAAFSKRFSFDTSIAVEGDTYATCHTPAVAFLAAGAAVRTVHAVVSGAAQSGFAILRPPGHHCHVDRAGGFCFFNNVAIAASYARRKLGVGRIAILDWDIHHGDGTQNIVQDYEDMLFVSIHRHDNGTFYPRSGAAEFTGRLRNCLNIPWPCKGLGDREYASAMEYLVLPVLAEFKPELILISSGFDAASGDPLGGMAVSPDGFRYLTSCVAALDPPRGVCLFLEGGYNLSSIALDAEGVVRALLEARGKSSRWTADTKEATPVLLRPPSRPLPMSLHRGALQAFEEALVAGAATGRWQSLVALRDSGTCAVPVMGAWLPPDSHVIYRQRVSNLAVLCDRVQESSSASSGMAIDTMHRVLQEIIGGLVVVAPLHATRRAVRLMQRDGTDASASSSPSVPMAPQQCVLNQAGNGVASAILPPPPSRSPAGPDPLVAPLSDETPSMAGDTIGVAPLFSDAWDGLHWLPLSDKGEVLIVQLAAISPGNSLIQLIILDDAERVHTALTLNPNARSAAAAQQSFSSVCSAAGVTAASHSLCIPVASEPIDACQDPMLSFASLYDDVAKDMSGRSRVLVLPPVHQRDASTTEPSSKSPRFTEQTFPSTETLWKWSRAAYYGYGAINGCHVEEVRPLFSNDAVATAQRAVSFAFPTARAAQAFRQALIASQRRALSRVSIAAGSVDASHTAVDSTQPLVPDAGESRDISSKLRLLESETPSDDQGALGLADPETPVSTVHHDARSSDDLMTSDGAPVPPIYMCVDPALVPWPQQTTHLCHIVLCRPSDADTTCASMLSAISAVTSDDAAGASTIDTRTLRLPGSRHPALSWQVIPAAASVPLAATEGPSLPVWFTPEAGFGHQLISGWVPPVRLALTVRSGLLLSEPPSNAVSEVTASAPNLCSSDERSDNQRCDVKHGHASGGGVEGEDWVVITALREWQPRQIASITKILTCWVVLRIVAALQEYISSRIESTPSIASDVGLPAGLLTRILISRRAAAVSGTSAKLEAHEAITILDLLHGALLPSGNDAATALAEHFGRYCAPESESDWRPFERAPHYSAHTWERTDALSCFVAEMNRAALALGLHRTVFANPHGLVHVRATSCAADAAALVATTWTESALRDAVKSPKYACEAIIVPVSLQTVLETRLGLAKNISPSASPSGEGTSNPSVTAQTVAADIIVADESTERLDPSMFSVRRLQRSPVPPPRVPHSDTASLASSLEVVADQTTALESAAVGKVPIIDATSASSREAVSKSASSCIVGGASARARNIPSRSRAIVAAVDSPVVRKVRWLSTNRLLGTRFTPNSTVGSTSNAWALEVQVDGVKTGITPGAMACLALHASSTNTAQLPEVPSSKAIRIISVTLGSTNVTMRFIDNQRVLQWSVDALGTVLANGVNPEAMTLA